MTAFFSSCRAASKVFAAAALDLFPNIQLKQEWIDPPFFAYEMVFPFVFQENFLILLQEKIRFMIKEDRGIRTFEMMPSNAGELLKHKGQPFRAEAALETDNSLVSMVEIGEFVDLLESEIVEESTGKVPVCELLGFIEQPLERKGTVRLIGVASSDFKEVKKKFKKYGKNCFVKRGEDLEVFSIQEKNLYFLDRGIQIKEILMKLWRAVLQEAQFAFIEGGEIFEDVFEVHNLFRKKKHFSLMAQMVFKENDEKEDFLEWFTPSSYLMGDCNHIFYLKDKTEEISRSCLQLLLKIPKMISLECRGVLKIPGRGRVFETEALKKALDEEGILYTAESGKGSEVSFELQASDGLGRWWKVATCGFVYTKETQLEKGKGCITVSLVSSLDRLVYLMLDHREGEFPAVLKNVIF